MSSTAQLKDPSGLHRQTSSVLTALLYLYRQQKFVFNPDVILSKNKKTHTYIYIYHQKYTLQKLNYCLVPAKPKGNIDTKGFSALMS